jgi:hypothetical protein
MICELCGLRIYGYEDSEPYGYGEAHVDCVDDVWGDDYEYDY